MAIRISSNGSRPSIRVAALLSASLFVFNVGPTAAGAPSNDNFANATVVTSLPFAATVDASSSTSEAGEPFPSCIAFQGATTWYSFTPSTNVYLQATSMKNGFLFAAGAYTGSSLATLQEVGCGIGGVAFQAAAGTTYHVQVLSGSVFDFGLSAIAPPAKPDARIRLLGGALRGNDLYNIDGAFQTLFALVPAGKSRRMVISIQNDSTGPDYST